MGAVPVAATLNVAVCPAVTVWLSGCVEITAGCACDDVPVPLKVNETCGPLSGIKVKTPEYACAAVGEKVTVAVILSYRFRLMGKAGPEYENCVVDDDTPTI